MRQVSRAMVAGGAISGDGTVGLLGAVSSYPGRERGSGGGPKGASPAVYGGRTAADRGWVSGGSGRIHGGEREREGRGRERECGCWAAPHPVQHKYPTK